ncbi:MAG TPA: acyl carrier protein [Marmoricola sp.]
MAEQQGSRPALTHDQARRTVLEVILRIVPDADVDAVTDATRLRAEFELDSLDFLSFVELLSSAAGRRIDETDYDRLETLGCCAELLTGSTAPTSPPT